MNPLVLTTTFYKCNVFDNKYCTKQIQIVAGRIRNLSKNKQIDVHWLDGVDLFNVMY